MKKLKKEVLNKKAGIVCMTGRFIALIFILVFSITAPVHSNVDINTHSGYKELKGYFDKIFFVSHDEMWNIIKDFHSEMLKGLSGSKSSLKMILSFADRARGTEKGKYIALDFGGTNFRVMSVELDGNKGCSISATEQFAIDRKCMKGTGEQLFYFIASRIKSFMAKNSIPFDKQLYLAFTFSFPVEQTNIAAGKLVVWVKGFTASEVVGKDVVIMLGEALKKVHINNLKIVALVNDTVGTLAAKSYTDSSCDMGVVLGTGTNACYTEKIINIKKWKGLSFPRETMMINIEWGNFNKLPVTVYDKEVDFASTNPGSQQLEKMVSGMFLGEIFKFVICDLIKRDLVFKDKYATNTLIESPDFTTKEMALIETDTSRDLKIVKAFLDRNGIKNSSLKSRKLVKHVNKLISCRSAKFAATATAAVVLWMDPELKNKHVIGIDGSLFEKYPGYKEMMNDALKSLLKEDAEKIVLEDAKDGSGIGAAIIAASTVSEK